MRNTNDFKSFLDFIVRIDLADFKKTVIEEILMSVHRFPIENWRNQNLDYILFQ